MAINPLSPKVFSVNCLNGNLYPCFPKDLLQSVLIRLPKFIDFCNFTETCSNLRVIHSDDTLCWLLFQKHFPNYPRLVPTQNWLTECQMQHRCIENSNNGVYLSRRFEIKECVYDGGELCSFALHDDGSILIGCRDGSLKSFNPSTKECKEVIPACSSWLQELTYEKGLCAAKFGDDTVRIWDLSDLNSPQEIQIPRGDGGLSSNKILGYGNCFNLVDGLLLVGYEDRIIQVWDPRSKELPITFKSHIGTPCDFALCDRTLFSNSLEKGQVAVWDLKSGECIKTLNYGCVVWFVSFQKKVFGAAEQGSDLCVWDLENFAPIPQRERCPELLDKYTGDRFVSNAQRSFYLARRFSRPPYNYENRSHDYDKCKKIKLSGSDHFITAACVKDACIWSGPIFSHGALFFVQDTLACVDFIASDEDILNELAQKLRSQDPDQQKEGIQRLSLMTYRVFNRVFEEAALVSSTPSAESFAQGIENYLAKLAAPKTGPSVDEKPRPSSAKSKSDRIFSMSSRIRKLVEKEAGVVLRFEIYLAKLFASKGTYTG